MILISAVARIPTCAARQPVTLAWHPDTPDVVNAIFRNTTWEFRRDILADSRVAPQSDKEALLFCTQGGNAAITLTPGSETEITVVIDGGTVDAFIGEVRQALKELH